MQKFLVTVGVNAVAIWAATIWLSGVVVDAPDGNASTGAKILTYLALGLIFGLVNAVVKPVVRLLSLPFYVLTLGLFAFVVNALMLQITEWIADATPLTFYIDDFFWSAILAAIVVTVVSMLINLV
ncbi:MAG: phage holin family protein, partial [Geodermatophilaceae bacterium]|nr:phage holin family protein [Geodermatophilaceae bacterium]